MVAVRAQSTNIPVPQCLSPRQNWDPPPCPANECVLCNPPPEPKEGVTHSSAGVGMWEPNSDDWRKSLALYLLCARVFSLAMVNKEGLEGKSSCISILVNYCRKAVWLPSSTIHLNFSSCNAFSKTADETQKEKYHLTLPNSCCILHNAFSLALPNWRQRTNKWIKKSMSYIAKLVSWNSILGRSLKQEDAAVNSLKIGKS